MRKFISARACVTLVFVAGCSNAQIQTAPALGSSANALRSGVHPDGNSVLYAVSGGIAWAYAFPSRQPFCTIQVPDGLVNGVGVDSSGTLWVPEQNEENGFYDTVSYGPNCGSQGVTLSSPLGYFPVNISFGSDGTKYEAMEKVPAQKFHGENWALVAAYAPGATSPTAILTDVHLTSAAGGPGLDAEGNVYVSCCTLENRKHPHKPSIIRFKAGGSTEHGTLISLLGMGHTPSTSVLFDQSGNMVLTDNDHATIDVYAPPYTGTPVTHPFHRAHVIDQCNFDQPKRTLACADVATGNVYVYRYPSFKVRFVIKPGFYETGGVAFFPPAPN